MAFGNWRDYLRGSEEVSLKKYLYVFRPLLACHWIERQLGQVPMLFAQLVEDVLDEADVRAALLNSSRCRSKCSHVSLRPNCHGSKRSTSRTIVESLSLSLDRDAACGQTQPPLHELYHIQRTKAVMNRL